jgi:hypothetical protein
LAYLATTHCKIEHPIEGKILFDLYPFQIDTLLQFQQYRINVVLKSRQMGISTLCAMYSLHQMLFKENFKILVIATKTEVARNLIKKVQVMYDNLPVWLRKMATISNNNKLELVLSNGSQIKAVSSKPDSARSEALSLLILDEFAFAEYAEEIWTSSQMTLATGGKAIILSTPNGVGNTFHKLWQKAEEGSTELGLGHMNPIKLKWDLHPDRTQEWRDAQTELLGPRKAAQECDVEFSTSGHTFIESDDLAYYRQNTKEPVERRGLGGDIWVWEYPQDGTDYIVTADVARGDGGDYSTYSVRNLTTFNQAAEYKGQVDTTTFANMLMSICHEYNQAYLIIDNKNIGWSTIQMIIDKNYPNLFYSYKNDPYLDKNIHLIKQYDLKSLDEMVPGFTITHILRPVMTEKLRIYTQERSLIINSTRAINELEVFLWLNGKPQAQKGYNDDLVMETCMFLYVKDTVLRLRSLGQNITRNSLNSMHKSVYKPRQEIATGWEQTYGNHKDHLKWLL